MTERHDDEELLRHQPHGRKGKSGRLLGSGGGYRRPGGGRNATLGRSLRIAQRRPQAILKITRYGHSGYKIIDHAHYIRRHGRLTLEDEAGNVIDDPAVIRRRVRQWVEMSGVNMEEPCAQVKRKRRVTAHFILDAGPEAKPEALTKTARQFLSERFGKDGHEYWFVRHDDTKQPHVHVILNLQNGEGRRLHTSVAEVQAWREQFSEIARQNGIEVDASRAWERGKAPARSRGYVRHGAPTPARWTREQVRRGLAARKQRLLSDAALASARGDRQGAEMLKTKAAGLHMRTDAVAVRRIAAEKRGKDAIKPWEIARARNSSRVAGELARDAARLALAARAEQDPRRKEVLQTGADRLRHFARGLRPNPTRAQQLATRLNRQLGSESDRDSPDQER
ncbi:MAG: Type secretory pathway VirD2 component [Nevskia sp.]|nr:Type secretory pathway VirD2 component [Nevskia sp.]